MKRLSEVKNSKKKILFLGYDETQTKIINVLINSNCMVDHTNEEVKANNTRYDFVVSYGYRHILKRDIIAEFNCPIFNLHTSYLPYNRGTHPNFWSFYENTPSGITLHLIDEGIDTGPIVSQRYVNFKKEDDTFFKTYIVLAEEIETLFLENLDAILLDQWSATKQRGIGSVHYARDLPNNFSGWNSNIKQEVEKLDKEGLKYD
jgi:methionyl-tRNA formyltransferase